MIKEVIKLSELIAPVVIEQQQYDKISDDLYFLGKNVVLKFNVNLSRPNQENQRNHYHKEYQYNSKYIDTSSVITIRRSFDFYLSIENLTRDDFGNKEYIRIGVPEIMSLRYYIEAVTRWFTDSKYESLYAKKNGRLIMLGRVENIRISNLPLDRYLEFEAMVCETPDGDMYPGVRIYLSSKTNYADMSIDRLMGFYYLISTINMYESAQLMLNYLQRPEYGTNMVSFCDDNLSSPEPQEYAIQTKTGRMVQPRRSL